MKENGLAVFIYEYYQNVNRIRAITKAETFQGFYDLQDRMTKYWDATYNYTANGKLEKKTDATVTTTYNRYGISSRGERQPSKEVATGFAI